MKYVENSTASPQIVAALEKIEGTVAKVVSITPDMSLTHFTHL